MEERKPVMLTCKKCKGEVDYRNARPRLFICPHCGNYMRVTARDRIWMVADPGTFEAWYEDLVTENPLDIADYPAKLAKSRETTTLTEGVIVGECEINGCAAVLGVIDARFLMGSMGQVVGERITRAVEEATKKRLPVILFCCSGGARMQEGIMSLMQMEKTSAALKRHSDAGNLYISVLTDPTTGGVTASFAMLGDIILAEPGAMIGFAGPRVIEQTIGEKLPEGFQSAEFQLEHGFVDKIVVRNELKDTLTKILVMHPQRSRLTRSIAHRKYQLNTLGRLQEERAKRRKAKEDAGEELLDVNKLTAYEKVQYVRQASRPGSEDYIDAIFDDFMEFHGDRYYRDDPVIFGGIGVFDGSPVTVIGIKRGKNLDEMMKNNFGMPSPEGYRKALRLMKQAEKFGRPIITFVNTSGAYPGKAAEENGQGEAIARNLFEMASLKVPVLAIMIGEGGSGGALALAVGNEVYMLENAIYSILSPEGFASILWKDGSRVAEAAEVMKITADDLKEMGVVDQVIPEYGGADQDSFPAIAEDIRMRIYDFLERMSNKRGDTLADERYQRFRKF